MEWIKVTDRLPDLDKDLLVFETTLSGNTDIHISSRSGNDWYRSCCCDEWYGEVTHWAELPEPPKD